MLVLFVLPFVPYVGFAGLLLIPPAIFMTLYYSVWLYQLAFRKGVGMKFLRSNVYQWKFMAENWGECKKPMMTICYCVGGIAVTIAGVFVRGLIWSLFGIT